MRKETPKANPRTIVCCKMHPILVKGTLAYVCYHTVPRSVKYPDGIFMLDKEGNPISFQDLTPIGQVHTDRFGWLTNYEYRGNNTAPVIRVRDEEGA